MVIGRSEARPNPWGPLRAHDAATLFGTRAAEAIRARGRARPHREAGHMTANAPIVRSSRPLLAGGRPHMDPAVEPRGDSIGARAAAARLPTGGRGRKG